MGFQHHPLGKKCRFRDVNGPDDLIKLKVSLFSVTVYRFVTSNLSYAVSALSASPVVKATRLGSVGFTGTSEHIAISGSVEMGECAIMFDILLVVSVKMPSWLEVTKHSCDTADN